MTKIFLDTNIWLRFFLKDNSQYEVVEQLITAVEEGIFSPYVSPVIFLELAYVFERTYKLSKSEVCKYLDAIATVRNITIIDKTLTQKALEYYKNNNVKFADCLIASQIPKGMVLVTFDKEFSKIKGLKLGAPAQILAA